MIVFADLIAEMLNNLGPTVAELFVRGKKINMSLLSITKSYFPLPKNTRLNSTHYCTMKIPKKRDIQQIAINNLRDIDFKDFMMFYKKMYRKKTYYFLGICLTVEE